MSALVEITKLPPPCAGGGWVLLFGASWHAESVPGGNVYNVMQALSTSSTLSQIQFGRVEAEACPDLVQALGVTVIPTVCLLDDSSKLVQKLEGVDEDVALVTQAVQALQERIKIGSSSTAASLATVTPTTESVVPPEDLLNAKLKRLINSAPVMVFIKGTPAAPRCGFSRQIVELLQENHMEFGSFDILQDEDVRQGLKTFSDWPTYPQLYVKGELIGGLDIVQEMMEDSESGTLAEQLGVEPNNSSQNLKPQEESLDKRLEKLVNRHRIMLFLKGLPSAPQCGFSRQVVELLDKHGANYDSFNILEDEEVRQGLKKYSDWPTYPQLYVEGDLVGGLDILKEMEENNELEELLKQQ